MAIWRDAQRVLHTCSYKHTLRICNTYCFSTPTVVTRTRHPMLHCTFIASLVEIRRVIESRDAILTKQQQDFHRILSNLTRCTHVERSGTRVAW